MDALCEGVQTSAQLTLLSFVREPSGTLDLAHQVYWFQKAAVGGKVTTPRGSGLGEKCRLAVT